MIWRVLICASGLALGSLIAACEPRCSDDVSGLPVGTFVLRSSPQGSPVGSVEIDREARIVRLVWTTETGGEVSVVATDGEVYIE